MYKICRFTELASELQEMEDIRKQNDSQQFISSSFMNLKQTMSESNTTKTMSINCSEFNPFNTPMYDISTSQLMSGSLDESYNLNSILGKTEVVDQTLETSANSQASEYLDNTSPKSVESQNSQNSNRSHDGVFLRPGAVSTRYVLFIVIKVLNIPHSRPSIFSLII